MDILGLDSTDPGDYDLALLNLMVLMDSVHGKDPVLRRRVLAEWENGQSLPVICREDEPCRQDNGRPA